MSGFSLFLILAALVSAPAALAAPPNPGTSSSVSDYERMLRVAQLKVNRLNALKREDTEGALSTSLVKNVLGRYYSVGDSWDVLACKAHSNMVAMNSDPTQTHYFCGVFHYKVLQVKPGALAQVKVQVTQKSSFGLKPADPAVSSLDLTMSDKFAQSKKTYHFVDHKTYAASPNGVHTSISPLELYPLDVPDIYTAEKLAPKQLPELPADIQKFAGAAGYGADLSKCAWFEQQDLFGREIQILWQHGDLWPTYLKTPNGIAILIRH